MVSLDAITAGGSETVDLNRAVYAAAETLWSQRGLKTMGESVMAKSLPDCATFATIKGRRSQRVALLSPAPCPIAGSIRAAINRPFGSM